MVGVSNLAQNCALNGSLNGLRHPPCYTLTYDQLLEEALEHVRTLPEDEQDRVADALIAFTRECHDYSFDDGEIAGIHHAMAQADRGEFATGAEMRTFSITRYEGPRHEGRGCRPSDPLNIPLEPERHRRWARPRADHECHFTLEAFPRLGHAGHVDGTLERIVPRTPHVIVYRIDLGDEDELVILRVYHVAQERSGRR
jgi:hypothetical protein